MVVSDRLGAAGLVVVGAVELCPGRRAVADSSSPVLLRREAINTTKAQSYLLVRVALLSWMAERNFYYVSGFHNANWGWTDGSEAIILG